MNKPSPRNKTIKLSEKEISEISKSLVTVKKSVTLDEIKNKIILGNSLKALDFFPKNSVDLVFTDPPYNLRKSYSSRIFNEMTDEQYEIWLESWIKKLSRIMKKNASIYICSEWRTSPIVYKVLKKYFTIQNRITWKRDKGRGAKRNWKNSHEDIWFATLGEGYTFNLEDVKVKKEIIAPYKNEKGEPKDWVEKNGEKFRMTHPHNIWTDLTVPFWSMPENTDHPTQKPEKLVERCLIASSNKGDFVFDPFLGSGTTVVAAKNLGRNFCGIEREKYYACLGVKRLEKLDQ